MLLLVEMLFPHHPTLEQLQVLNIHEFIFDQLRYFCEWAVLIRADEISFSMSVWSSPTLMFLDERVPIGSTEEPSHWAHVAPEFVLAGESSTLMVATRTLWTHSQTEETRQDDAHQYLESLRASVRILCLHNSPVPLWRQRYGCSCVVVVILLEFGEGVTRVLAALFKKICWTRAGVGVRVAIVWAAM